MPRWDAPEWEPNQDNAGAARCCSPAEGIEVGPMLLGRLIAAKKKMEELFSSFWMKVVPKGETARSWLDTICIAGVAQIQSQ
jgi:hypothetical protein